MVLHSGEALRVEVERYAERVGYVPARQAAEGWTAWLSELTAWNSRLDLTAAGTDEELVELMIGDAIALAQVVPGDAAVVDVGTGAGAPGVGLACARPDLAVTLVEPLQKRCAFLRQAVARAGCTRTALVHGRIEAATRALGEATFLVSRATFAPADWLGRAAKHASNGALIAVLLAREAVPEAEGVVLRATHRYRLGTSGRERTIAVFERLHAS